MPRPTVTRFGIVCPATQFRLEALGRGVPPGQTVRKDGAVVLVTVVLRTTAVTPVAGTPP